MKFNIRKEESNFAFTLYHSSHELLFTMGKGADICIYKEENKTECYCIPSSYDYQGLENVLVGKKGQTSPFTVKKIVVLQMENDNEDI